MHSRAFLLLRRDLINIKRLPLEGIAASPLSEENVYEWNATIKGLEGTAWEGGTFCVNLRFSDSYNTSPPSVQFMTIPYHPNVHPHTGIPSMGLLMKGEWNEGYTLASLLLNIQVLLSNPELDTGCIVNHKAAYHYKHLPHTYKQLVFDCVAASARIQAGLPPYEADSELSSPQPPHLLSSALRPVLQQDKRFRKVSFDDYHSFWQGLATSVPAYNPDNEFMQLLDKDQFLKQVHYENEFHKTGDLRQRTEEHLTLKYGISKRDKNVKTMTVKERQKRIADMASLYANKVSSPLTTTAAAADEELATSKCEDVIDDLLEWTTKLDEKELDSITVH